MKSPLVFSVHLGGPPDTTDKIVSELGFLVDPQITQEAYPLRSRGDARIVVFDPKRGSPFMASESIRALGAYRLVVPTYEHVLYFAHQVHDPQNEGHPNVVFPLGPTEFMIFRWRENRNIPDCKRQLRLLRMDAELIPCCFFAGMEQRVGQGRAVGSAVVQMPELVPA